MPAASYSSAGDVTVSEPVSYSSAGAGRRMMPVPSSSSSTSGLSSASRRSFSSSAGATSGTTGLSSGYKYRTLDRPSHLNAVGATSSYLTSSRPSRFTSDYKSSDYKSSDYKSSVLDLKPSAYSSSTSSYRSRYTSGMTSTASSYSYSRSSAHTSNNDTDRDRNSDTGYLTSSLGRSRLGNSDTTSTSSVTTNSYSSLGRRGLDSTSSNAAPSSSTSRYQRSSILDTAPSNSSPITNDSSSRYKSSYLNDTRSRLGNSIATRSRATEASELTPEENNKEEGEEVRRPSVSVAEMRRLFDPVLAQDSTSTTTTTSSSPPPGSSSSASAAASSSGPAPSGSSPKDEESSKDSESKDKPDSDDEDSDDSSSESSESSSETEAAASTVTPVSPRRSRANTGLPAGSEENLVTQDAEEGGSVLDGSPTLSSRKNAGSERGGLVGLRNIGNTCFMNSVLQCLSNTRPLLEYVLGETHLAEINTTTSSMKGALIKAFASLLQELWRADSDERVVNTSTFKGQVQRFAPRFMGYSQQDAQEFLRYLLEGLHEDVNRVTIKPKPILTEIEDSLSDQQKAMEGWKRYLRRDDSKIVDIFVGQLKSTLRCTVCGHCSVTFDPFWDLSLPIPSAHGQVKMSQCFDLFTKEEVLDGDEKPTCSKCQTRQKCTKSFCIQKFPKILVLHLKRFSPMERFRGKLNCTVDFPLSGLDLSPYAASRSQQCSYNLYGVANHSGTTYSGHYIAYCKHPYSSSWHEYNDSRVSTISTRSVVSCEAYVLFYELAGSSSSHL